MSAIARGTSADEDGSLRPVAYGFGGCNSACFVLNAVGATVGSDPEVAAVVGTVNLGLAITNFVVGAIDKEPPLTVAPRVSMDRKGRASGSLAFSGSF